jgi:hypothetical protein
MPKTDIPFILQKHAQKLIGAVTGHRNFNGVVFINNLYAPRFATTRTATVVNCA